MSKTNSVETNPVKRIIIPQTVLGGWKGSAITAVLFFILSVNGLFNGSGDLSVAFFCAGCGWGGWAIQEYEHLNGYLIKDTYRRDTDEQ